MINRYASLRQGLVGAWCPSLGASGYRLIDRSGNNNHGVLTGMDPGTDWVPSGGKLALDFDGVNDYVLAQNRPLIESTYTACGWLLVRSSNINRAVVVYRSSIDVTPVAFNLFVNASNLAAFAIRDDNGNIASISGESITINKWFHFCGVRNLSNVTLFVNAIQIANTTASLGTISANNLMIGAQNPGVIDSYIDGQIDDIRIYNRALTPSEIRLLYTGGRGIGLLPERIKHRRKTTAAASNRRRRLICGANC